MNSPAAAFAGAAAALLLAALPLWLQQARFAASRVASEPVPEPQPPFLKRWQAARSAGGSGSAELRAAELAESLTADQCRAAAEAALAGGNRAPLRDVLSRWASLDGAAAFAWLERHPDLLGEDSFPDEAAAAWAATDPSGLSGWLATFLGTVQANCEFDELPGVSGLMQHDLRAAIRLAGNACSNSPVGVGIGRNDLRPAIRSSADAEAVGAEILAHPEWLANIEEGKPLYLLIALRECWQEIDPDAWDRWAAAHPQAAEKSDPAPVNSGIQFLRSPDRAAAATRLLETAPPEHLEDYATQLLRLWDDPEAVGHWVNSLPDGPVKSAAAQSSAVSLAAGDPATAFQQASVIPDPGVRERASRRIFTAWHAADPAAAEAWLPESGWSAAQRQAARDIIASAPDP